MAVCLKTDPVGHKRHGRDKNPLADYSENKVPLKQCTRLNRRMAHDIFACRVYPQGKRRQSCGCQVDPQNMNRQQRRIPVKDGCHKKG